MIESGASSLMSLSKSDEYIFSDKKSNSCSLNGYGMRVDGESGDRCIRNTVCKSSRSCGEFASATMER